MTSWSRVKQKGMTITSCKVKGKALKHANHNSVPIKSIDGFTCSCIMGNQGKIVKKQRGKRYCFSSFFRSELHFQEETFTASRETCNLRLLAFLGRSSDCCGRRNFFTVKYRRIRSSPLKPQK